MYTPGAILAVYLVAKYCYQDNFRKITFKNIVADVIFPEFAYWFACTFITAYENWSILVLPTIITFALAWGFVVSLATENTFNKDILRLLGIVALHYLVGVSSLMLLFLFAFNTINNVTSEKVEKKDEGLVLNKVDSEKAAIAVSESVYGLVKNLCDLYNEALPNENIKPMNYSFSITTGDNEKSNQEDNQGDNEKSNEKSNEEDNQEDNEEYNKEDNQGDNEKSDADVYLYSDQDDTAATKDN